MRSLTGATFVRNVGKGIAVVGEVVEENANEVCLCMFGEIKCVVKCALRKLKSVQAAIIFLILFFEPGLNYL
jgi:hypothetical protein